MGCISRGDALVGGLCKRGRFALSNCRFSQHQLPVHFSRPRVEAWRQCMQNNTPFYARSSICGGSTRTRDVHGAMVSSHAVLAAAL
jgi:hypothetical protein